jgi:hypothetical protein
MQKIGHEYKKKNSLQYESAGIIKYFLNFLYKTGWIAL